MIVVVEGFDGAGKGTIIKAVQAILEEHGFTSTTVEGIADPIRPLFKSHGTEFTDHTRLYLACACISHACSIAKQKEQDHDVVILDRAIVSTKAYQLDHLSGDQYFELLPAVKNAMAGCTPEFLFYVDTPLDVCLKRRDIDIDDCAMEAKDLAFKKKTFARQKYHASRTFPATECEVVFVSGESDPREEALICASKIISKLI